MAKEASGAHMYDPGGMFGSRLLARFVNNVSKIHDWFNIVNYSNSGLYLSRGVMFDSAFQIYSFAGMPMAGALTVAHYVGNDPALMSSQFDARRRRESQ